MRLPKKGNDTHFYDVLEISKDATADDIKRAYRKQALKYHPDKATAGDRAENEHMFKEVNRANSVLSNPETRKIYDDFGEQGLALYEQGVFGEDAEILKLMQLFQNPALRAVLCCVLLVLGPLLILVPVFVSLKVDGKVGWSWPVVFIPLWILNVLPLIYSLCILPCMGKSRARSLFSILQYAVLLAFQIMLCVRLEHQSDSVLTWTEVFIPIYIFEAVALIKALFGASPGAYKQKMYGDQTASDEAGEGGAPHGPDGVLQSNYMAFALRKLFLQACMVAFIVLVVYRLSSGAQWSWWFVSIPLFVLLAWKFAIHVADAHWRLEHIPEGPERQQAKGFIITLAVLYGLFIGACVCFVALCTAKVAGVTSFTLAQAFIPLFIFLALIACCGCILGPVCCCLTGDNMMEDEENQSGPENGNGQLPPFVIKRQRYLEATASERESQKLRV